VAQSLSITLDFCSGHGLRVVRLSPASGSVLGMEDPAWDSLSPSPSAPPLSLKKRGYVLLCSFSVNFIPSLPASQLNFLSLRALVLLLPLITSKSIIDCPLFHKDLLETSCVFHYLIPLS